MAYGAAAKEYVRKKDTDDEVKNIKPRSKGEEDFVKQHTVNFEDDPNSDEAQHTAHTKHSGDHKGHEPSRPKSEQPKTFEKFRAMGGYGQKSYRGIDKADNGERKMPTVREEEEAEVVEEAFNPHEHANVKSLGKLMDKGGYGSSTEGIGHVVYGGKHKDGTHKYHFSYHDDVGHTTSTYYHDEKGKKSDFEYMPKDHKSRSQAINHVKRQAVKEDIDHIAPVEHNMIDMLAATLFEGGAPSRLKKHPMYHPNDYTYFRSKGYSDNDVKTIWDRDHREGKKPVSWEGKTAQSKLQYHKRSKNP